LAPVTRTCIPSPNFVAHRLFFALDVLHQEFARVWRG
jgi:hypothetical protein